MTEKLDKYFNVKTYHSRKNLIFNCFSYCVSSYLSSHNLPYQWLFSDSCGFLYKSKEWFFYDYYGMVENNLKKLYNVEIYSSDEDYGTILNKYDMSIGSNHFLIVLGDVWHLPWMPYYQKEHGPHFFIVTGQNFQGDQLHIIDVKYNFSGFVEEDKIRLSYESNGDNKELYVLTTLPHINTSKLMLKNQIYSGINKIKGDIKAYYVHGENIYRPLGYNKFGIEGIRALSSDVANMQEEGINYLKSWYTDMKYIVYGKEAYLEFLNYLKYGNDGVFDKYIDESFISLINSSSLKWQYLRNGLMKSFITKRYSYVQTERKILELIEDEYLILQYLKRISNSI